MISDNYKTESKDGQVAQGMNRDGNQKIFFDFICNREEDPAYELCDWNGKSGGVGVGQYK
jgi:hypothetical protein